MSWWEKEKKFEPSPPRRDDGAAMPVAVSTADSVDHPHYIPEMSNSMLDMTSRGSNPSAAGSQTVLGGSVIVRGEISASEDLLIEGTLEGNISLQDHCVTVGPKGRVKADIKARQVVVHGAVEGKISAAEKIDIRKTGNVVGDLLSAGIAIEDGAYFKGSIEIQRSEGKERSRAVAAAVKTAVTPAI